MLSDIELKKKVDILTNKLKAVDVMVKIDGEKKTNIRNQHNTHPLHYPPLVKGNPCRVGVGNIGGGYYADYIEHLSLIRQIINCRK